MRTWKRISAGVLAALALFSLVPAPRARAADTATAAGSGVRITQKAAWDTSVPGGTAVNVSIKITSDMDLQKPKDVVFVVDRSILQDLDGWKDRVRELVTCLSKVPGMRYALVSYASTPDAPMDFTTDAGALTARVNALTKGVNSDAYAALRQAESLINSRSGPRNPACIAYIGNGRFNMNYHKTLSYSKELLENVPVYCPMSGAEGVFQSELNAISGGRVLSVFEAAMEIGESRVCTVTVSGQMAADFAASSATARFGGREIPAQLDKDTGTASYTAELTMGRGAELTVHANLKDPNLVGEITVCDKAAVSLEGQTVETGPVTLSRSGYRVTYDPNGGAGKVPVDNTRYGGGTVVTLKPASLQRDGWNFSGWTHSNIGIRGGKFTITGDTTVKAAWGRAHVKLSSSTITGLTGTDMLSRPEIESIDGKAFYAYWNRLDSITFHNEVDIPADVDLKWDITNTKGTQSKAGAVMAWLIPTRVNEYSTQYYDLHIGGKGGVIAPPNCKSLFESQAYSLKSISGLNYLDTSHVTTMERMFAVPADGFMTSVTELDLNTWDTSQVVNMSEMFCGSNHYGNALQTIKCANWDTSKVTDMSDMFYKCDSLTTLDIKSWDTSSVTNMSQMFYICSRLPSLDLNNWDTSNVTNMEKMFDSCSSLKSLNVTGWNTENVTSFYSTFESCGSLLSLDLSSWSSASAASMLMMFGNCKKLTEIKLGEKWTLSNTGSVDRMFSNCVSLKTLDTSAWTLENTGNFNQMFYNCSSLEELDVGSWTPRYTGYPTYTGMFQGCAGLKRLINDSSLVINNLRSASYMFDGCSSLESLDLRGWTFISEPGYNGQFSVAGMFQNCSSLKELDLSGWDTIWFKNASYLFKGCSSLESLDLSGWNTARINNINEMFNGCAKLNGIGVTGNWTFAEGCNFANWRVGANAALDSIVIYAGTERGKGDLYTDGTPVPDPNTASSLSAESPEAEADLSSAPAEESAPPAPAAPEETPAAPLIPGEAPGEEEPEVPEEETIAAASGEESLEVPAEEKTITEVPGEEEAIEAALPDEAPSTDPLDLLDGNQRPVYARKKIGVWDCGRVRPGQKIHYSLELQYLGDDVETRGGGVSGLLTVTNPIPEGLTLLKDTLHISETAGWIIDGAGYGSPEGAIVQEPQVDENNVLTFSVSGLSMGARYTVYYTCTAPAQAPAGYVEFLNTASVDDNGLPDEADPVRHYMLAEDQTVPPEKFPVSYSYDGDTPDGAPAYGTVTYAAGTMITLPKPTAPGWEFNGWKIAGEGSVITTHTVTEAVHFVGTWTRTEIPMVRIDYKFTTPGPENAGAIQNALLADAVTEAPENTVTSAPVLVSPPAGWRLEWQYPEKLRVAEDGTFNVGRQSDWTNGTIPITGKWIPEEFTVTYVYQNAPTGADPLPNPGTHPCGASVTLAPDAANTGNSIFLGWFLPADVPLGENRAFTMPAKNVTVTGRWAQKPAEQEVLVDPNEGLWRDSPLQQVLTLAKYTEMTGNNAFPDPVRDGYTFDKWEDTPCSTGSFARIVTALWKVPETPGETCTLTFDSQGGTEVKDPVRTVEKNSLAAKPEDPVREGYAFQGWSRTPNGTDRWNFAEDRVPGTMTLYAVWAEQTYKITGQVVDENNKPIPGARVEIVHAGHRVFQETETDADGKYIIDKVPNGVYNTVATYQRDGTEVTTTVLSVISGENLENQTIRFASGNTNSHLKVDHMPTDTPYVVVGGLMVESGAVRENEKDADSVEVRMEVSPTDRAQKREDVAKLQTAAEEAVKDVIASGHRTVLDLVLDFDLSQTVKPAGGAETTQKITETSAGNILRIVIPYPTEGKANILVHRCHGGEAVTFKKLTVLPKEQEPLTDGTFYLDTSANLIYVFASRFSVYAVSYTAPPATTPPVTPPSGGGGGGTASYLITATAGPGGTIQPEGKIRVSSGGSRTFTIRPAAGCTVREVLVDGESVGAVSTYTFSNIRSNHTIEAFFDTDTGGLFREDHIDYLHGFRDGLFRPGAPMTRGQAAQMFYNLLRDRETGGGSHFSDVPESMWCYEAVSALKTLGIMVGVTADRFEPDRPITRGELVVTATRFTEHDPAGPSPFSDVADTDWYAAQISAAAARGWIGGYGDGTFRPNAPITRAQAARVINRLLNRAGDEAFIGSAPAGLRTFPDVAESYWAYLDIEESANAHDYRIHGAGETWTALR